MALELRQQLKLSQQLVMTPQLQMAIKLLQLSRLELVDAITQELEENPALEEIQEIAEKEDSDVQVNDDISAKEVTIEEKLNDEIDWSNYIEEYNSPGKASFESEGKEAPQYEAFIAKKENLSDHLLWQFLMASPEKEDEKIASLIVGNLNRNGFLDISIEEIAAAANTSTEKIEEVLALLQTFDPVGVCAKNLQDSLLIQAKHFKCDNDIVCSIIKDHISNLENKNYKAIAKALKKDIKRIIDAVNIIKSLDPRPGLKYNNEEPQYITPDIYVYKMDNEFVIVLNDDGMPRLRVNAFYQNAMNNTMNSKDKIAGKTREYMQEKIRSASWLIKSIHQRQKTIYKVMESILKFQKDFFEKGISHLKPMVLRDVADDIEMHESTISRVTTNKYVYTEQGIFELKYFFNSSINSVEGSALSSASVQQKIRQIIESEAPKKPFSDKKISQMLIESNIDIARRTVAKYREIMKILPSNKRKQF